MFRDHPLTDESSIGPGSLILNILWLALGGAVAAVETGRPAHPHLVEPGRSIAGRAVASLVTTQGVGDLYRMYATAQRDGVDFNLTFIPADFRFPHREEFDNDYMRKLYALGYDLAVKGVPWAKTPPGFQAADTAK
mgnify:CR=1 FL=1